MDENIQVNEDSKLMPHSSKQEFNQYKREMKYQNLDLVTISLKTSVQSLISKEFNCIKINSEVNQQTIQGQIHPISESQTECLPLKQNSGSVKKLDIKVSSPLKENESPTTIKDTLNLIKKRFRTESYYGASCFASILEENKNNPPLKSLLANTIIEENDLGVGEENEMEIDNYPKQKTIIKNQNPFELFKNIEELGMQHFDKKLITSILSDNNHKNEIPSTIHNSLAEKDLFNEKCCRKENIDINENSLKEEESIIDKNDDSENENNNLQELNEALNPISNQEFILEESIV